MLILWLASTLIGTILAAVEYYHARQDMEYAFAHHTNGRRLAAQIHVNASLRLLMTQSIFLVLGIYETIMVLAEGDGLLSVGISAIALILLATQAVQLWALIDRHRFRDKVLRQ